MSQKGISSRMCCTLCERCGNSGLACLNMAVSSLERDMCWSRVKGIFPSIVTFLSVPFESSSELKKHSRCQQSGSGSGQGDGLLLPAQLSRAARVILGHHADFGRKRSKFKNLLLRLLTAEYCCKVWTFTSTFFFYHFNLASVSQLRPYACKKKVKLSP